jgi:hypothetical protein
MEELFPVLLAAALGVANAFYTQGTLQWILNCLTVVLGGLAATTFTGEFQQSWLYLFKDLGEAAVGLALGLIIARWVLQQIGMEHGVQLRDPNGRTPTPR